MCGICGDSRELVVGVRHGRLTVVALLGRRGRRNYVLCRCECGQELELVDYSVRSGHTKSCGCLQRERAKAANTRHGDTPRSGWASEYVVWTNMITRCTNPKSSDWENYGGRGIRVCDRWLCSYRAFLDDMGRRPSSGHTIERSDNNGNYEPNNCRWILRTLQASNRRNNRRITAFGETLILAEWARRLGIQPETISNRLRRGQAPEVALSEAKR